MAIQCKEINGLYIFMNVYTNEEEQKYCEYLEKECENPNIVKQIHKCTQYGYAFDIKNPDLITEFPVWINDIWQTFMKHFDETYNTDTYNDPIMQAIQKCTPKNVLINTYPVGDGCNDHIDDYHFWTSWIVGVSFGSGCTMEFKYDQNVVKYYIPARSVYILSGDARYKWTHGIPFTTTDTYYGLVIPRTTRYSLTFRDIAKL